MPAHLPKKDKGKPPPPREGPLIEGSRVVRPRLWGQRATRWVYAESRQVVQTYGLRGLVIRLFSVACLLAVLCAGSFAIAFALWT